MVGSKPLAKEIDNGGSAAVNNSNPFAFPRNGPPTGAGGGPPIAPPKKSGPRPPQ